MSPKPQFQNPKRQTNGAARGKCWLAAIWCLAFVVWPLRAASHTYADVDVIFTAHCLDCHEAKDPEGNLVLENFESLMKGGEAGAAIIPGKSTESLLVRMLEGKVTKDGKQLIMPPGKRKKLSAEDIAVIKAWIDDGAKPPAEARPKELVVPKIAPQGNPRQPINSLAYSAAAKIVAVGKYGEVELRNADDFSVIRKLS